MKDTTERYKYVDDTLARAYEVLEYPVIAKAIGGRAVTQSQASLKQLFVPNVVGTRGRFVYLQTPDAYKDHPSAIAVMAGYPGERLVGDASMSRQTDAQQQRAITLLTCYLDDPQKAETSIARLDERLKTRRRQQDYLVRYAVFAAILAEYRTLHHRTGNYALMHRPFFALTMGALSEGRTQTGPATTLHELVHLRDYIAGSVIALRRPGAMKDHTLRSELKAHRLGSAVEQILVAEGLVQAADDADNHDAQCVSQAQEFEGIRARYANPHDPYRPLKSIRDDLANARLY
jgi:hypothetical protein